MATSFYPLTFLLACGLLFSAFVPAAADFFTDEFHKWMKDHSVQYKSDLEAQNRFAIFKENYLFINESNNNQALGFTLGLNRFADLTNDEFLVRFTGYSPPTSNRTSTSFRYANVTAPSSMDWRSLGAVTGVKDQEDCALLHGNKKPTALKLLGIWCSCYHRRDNDDKKGYLPILSEQELVDCVSDNNGCSGGWQDYAFEWVINNGGIDSEVDYGYIAQDGTCDATKVKNYAATITGYEDVPSGSETALMNAVANQPVTVTIDASGMFFQFYSSGIFRGPCGTNQDHVVTAVGYGGEDNSKYWIMKNSWGMAWGENGYLRMWKDTTFPSGLCGITLGSSYPVA